LLIANGTHPSTDWYPNSCTTHHVKPYANNVQQSIPYEIPDQIVVGNEWPRFAYSIH